MVETGLPECFQHGLRVFILPPPVQLFRPFEFMGCDRPEATESESI